MTLEEKLQQAAERATGALATRVDRSPIVETFRGETIWEGVVDTFQTPKGRVYCWAVEGDQEPQYFAVLGTPPINSPIDAVRAWIVSQHRK